MSAAQALPCEDLSVGRGADVSGRRFGLLTAVRVVEKGERGNVWLLQCDCGRFAKRSLTRLNQSTRDGHEPMCRECQFELFRGARVERRSSSGARWAWQFASTGLLYSENAEARYRDDIRSAIADRLGFHPYTTAERIGEITYLDDARNPRQDCPLFRILAKTGRFWACATCGKPFVVGFGCLDCVGGVCGPCVVRELHACWQPVLSLKQLGNSLDPPVSSERTRQIEAKALRKLRHPSRAKWLREFVSDDPTSWHFSGRFGAVGVEHCGKALRLTESGIEYCRVCGLTFPNRSDLEAIQTSEGWPR